MAENNNDPLNTSHDRTDSAGSSDLIDLPLQPDKNDGPPASSSPPQQHHLQVPISQPVVQDTTINTPVASTVDGPINSPIDGEEAKDVANESDAGSGRGDSNSLFRFLLNGTTLSRAFWLFFLALLFFGFSILCSPFQAPVHYIASNRWPYRETHRLVSVSFAGTALVLFILHTSLRIINRFEGNTFLLYLEELEAYIAGIVWAIIEYGLSWYPELEIVKLVIGEAGKSIPKDSDVDLVPASELLNSARSVFICLAGTLILLAMKKRWMRNLGMSFNYANYMERIQECLWAERVLQSLMKSRAAYKFRSRWKSIMPIFSGGSAGGRRTDILASAPMDPTATVTSDQSIASPVQSSLIASNEAVNNTASKPATTNGKKDKESDRKRDFDAFLLLANKTLVHMDSAANISDYKAETAKESKRLATKLYQWLRPPNRDYLVANDFSAYLEDPEDVKKLVGMLNRRSGDIVAISEADLRRVIEGILQERFGLAKSMQSIETALGRIDSIFSFAVFFSAAILLALMFTGVGESLTALTAFVSALSFVFASSAGQLFESIVFLLIIHPFDVGDRVYIALGTNSIPPYGEVGMDNLVVSSMHVLSTEFERWDGVKVYVPNYILANRPIFNVRRSGPINDFLRVQIDYNTPTDRIAEFRRRVDAFCKKESADFTGYSRVNIEYMENCNRLGMFVVVQHRTNWQDYDLQLARRTKVYTFVKAVLDELSVGYLPPLQRVAQVTLGNTQM